VWGICQVIIAALATTCSLAHAAPPPCKPTALLEGDARSGELVAHELSALGVSTEASTGCRASTVYLASPEQGFRVAIPLGSGYTVRSPGSAQAAARIIASVLSDAPVRRPAAVAALESPRPHPSRTLSHFAAELTLGEHDAGLAVLGSLCGRVGPVCLGGAFRASNATVSGGLVETARTELNLMVILEEPFHVGRVMLTPWESLGGGLLRTYLPEQPASNLFDRTCTASFTGCASQTTQNQLGLRLEAGLAASVPIGERVSLTAHAAWTLAPAAHTSVYLASSVRDIPLLPGEPFWLGHAGFGLQFD
jgi:hypothetical protein